MFNLYTESISHQGVNDQVPQEAWSGRKSSANILKILGV